MGLFNPYALYGFNYSPYNNYNFTPFINPSNNVYGGVYPSAYYNPYQYSGNYYYRY
jgi:hypothetical protein